MTFDLKFWVDIGQIASGVGGVAAAIGVGIAVKQLKLLQQQSTTSFEDRLVDDYRSIAAELPLEALLGAEITETELKNALPAFYRYFDLCNQQAYLHHQGRITLSTWALWKDGIESNLRRPAFALAWTEIAARVVGDFDELRTLCPPSAQKPEQPAMQEAT